MEASAHSQSWPRGIAVAAGAYAMAGGLLTIVGWATNIERLTDWRNDGISMFPNTAACAAMSGLALLLASLSAERARANVRLLSVAIALVSGLTLLEHITGVDLGIDTLLFERTWGQAAAAAPMRMGPPASASFLLLATALLSMTLGARARATSAALGMVVIMIGMLSLTGHLYGASQMYTLPRLTGIAMQTASIIVALGFGLLASLPEREPMRSLGEDTAAGALTRQALPFLFVLSLGLGAIRVALEKYGFVDAPFGTALRSVVELCLLTGLLWWAAARVRKHEQAEKELLRVAETAREEAEEASRAKDEFLAMLAHELRNPLSAVRNAITAATLDARSRDRALEIAHRQTGQLGRIVDDLLDVARITRGRVPLRKERVLLSDVVRRAADGCRGTMEERGHSFTVSLPAEPVTVEADAARLEQAIANMLSNAAKYTDPGGTVVLVAELDGGNAVVRVRDDGMGIAPEVLPKVFDLFTQGHRALDRAQGGLGIGLTLVRRIVELHGGTVEAHSPGPGGGSEFVIRLPAVPPTAEAIAAPPAPAVVPQVQAPARVLMVEDNPDAAESLVMILELLGHHVRVVNDGVSALEAARANVPDLMLVDIGLPQMNGYELAQAIRRDAKLEKIVLVALTGYGRAEDKAQAMAAGFDYHLVKPVDLEILGDLVARLGLDAKALH